MSAEDSSAISRGRPMVAAALAAMDAQTAREAEPALDWLLAEDEDLDQISGLHLLEFLYYQLPVKWLCEPRVHHDIAWALGDLFRAAGQDRRAEVCRAQATHELIDLWDQDPEKARARMRTLIKDSGLSPAENSLLDWGSMHGMTEYAVLMAVSDALDRAVADGRLVPGGRGWRARATELTEEALRQPGSGGSSLLADVLGERVRGWSARMARRGLLIPDDLLAALAEPQAGLEPVGQTLQPLRWLLEQAEAGIKLTTSGYLPVALVHAADDRFPLRSWRGMRVRSESDLPQLTELREVVQRARLTNKAKGRLSLTAKGRKALGDPHALARAVLPVVFDESTWSGDGAVFQAYWLLQPHASRREARDPALHTYLSARWSHGSRLAPVSLAPHEIYSALWGFDAIANACTWHDGEPEAMRGGLPTLNQQGRLAVLAGLRVAAQAPSQRPFA